MTKSCTKESVYYTNVLVKKFDLKDKMGKIQREKPNTKQF